MFVVPTNLECQRSGGSFMIIVYRNVGMPQEKTTGISRIKGLSKESHSYQQNPSGAEEEYTPCDKRRNILKVKSSCAEIPPSTEEGIEYNLCEGTFSQLARLNTHHIDDNILRIHIEEKPFSCTVCEKRFYQESTLKTHLRSHTGEKPFACTVCEKRFSQVGNLKVHLNSHTGEKTFACIVCKKSFSQKSNLKTHLRAHTGEKPFACTLCEKIFSHKVNLKAHLRTHMGKKPFACSVRKDFLCSGI